MADIRSEGWVRDKQMLKGEWDGGREVGRRGQDSP